MALDPNQLPPGLLRLLGIETNSKETYELLRQFLTPSWREVSHKEHIGDFMQKMSITLATHVLSCTCAGCGICVGLQATFCTPNIFLLAIEKRFSMYSDDHEEVFGIVEIWKSQELVTLVNDPRYIIFRCNWDEQLVLGSITRSITQDVFKNSGIGV